MKILGVMATHQRPGITKATLNMLKNNQTLPFHEIVVAGDSDVDRKCVEAAECEFVMVPNYPLGRKYQCALAWAKTFDPDMVVILGSDTWLSNGWVEECAKHINSGYDCVGKIDWHTLKINPGKPVELYHRQYIYRPDPVGGGRALSATMLDKIYWDWFPITSNAGLDWASFKRFDGKPKIMATQIPHVMGIKGPWPTINRADNIKDSESIKVLKKWETDDIAPWVGQYFTGGIETLSAIIPNVKWGVGVDID